MHSSHCWTYRAPSAAVLTFVEFHKDGVGGVDGLAGAISVTVSPDGKHLYAAGFDEVDGLAVPVSVTVSPDGKHQYAAGVFDSAVAVFRVTCPTCPPPTCNSTVDLSFANGVTTWTFVVGADEPSTWSTSVIILGNNIPLWSIELPAIPPITISFSFPIPPIGVIEVQNALAVEGGVCSASDAVHTGP